MKKHLLYAQIVLVTLLQLIQCNWCLAQKPLQGEINQAGQTKSTPLKGTVGKNGPLQGHVGKGGGVLPAVKLHMTQAQLDAAVGQYKSDLSQFYMHAKEYHVASEALKKQIGTCTENEQQWQATLEANKLKISAVTIPTGVQNMPPPPPVPPDIPPPRVCCARCLITGECGHLGTGGGNQTSPGQARANAIKVQEAAKELASAQGRLNMAEQENGLTTQKAINEAQVEESQQNLAEKFGRLQQEYGLLKIEKEALTGVKVK